MQEMTNIDSFFTKKKFDKKVVSMFYTSKALNFLQYGLLLQAFYNSYDFLQNFFLATKKC